jgi:hypothetical protein
MAVIPVGGRTAERPGPGPGEMAPTCGEARPPALPTDVGGIRHPAAAAATADAGPTTDAGRMGAVRRGAGRRTVGGRPHAWVGRQEARLRGGADQPRQAAARRDETRPVGARHRTVVGRHRRAVGQRDGSRMDGVWQDRLDGRHRDADHCPAPASTDGDRVNPPGHSGSSGPGRMSVAPTVGKGARPGVGRRPRHGTRNRTGTGIRVRRPADADAASHREYRAGARARPVAHHRTIARRRSVAGLPRRLDVIHRARGPGLDAWG